MTALLASPVGAIHADENSCIVCRSAAIRHVREIPVTRSRFWAFSLGLVTYRAQSDSKNAASQVSVTQNIQSEHGVFSLGPEAQSLDIRVSCDRYHIVCT